MGDRPGAAPLNHGGRFRAALALMAGLVVLTAGLGLRAHAVMGPLGALEGVTLDGVVWLLTGLALLAAWFSRPRVDRILDWGLLPFAVATAIAMIILAEFRPLYETRLQAVGLETAGGCALVIAMIRFLRARVRTQVRPLRKPSKTKTRLVDDAGQKVDAVPPDELVAGDRIYVKAGTDIPVDGVIDQGTGFVDEAIVRGPGKATSKGVTDVVYEGTTCGAPELFIRTAAPRARSLVSQAENHTGALADQLMKSSAGMRGWAVITALIVFGNIALVIVLAEIPREYTWLPTIGGLLLSAPLAAVALAQVASRLEALAALRRHGLFVSRVRDLVVLTEAKRFGVDPMLVAAPGTAEAVALADVPPATLISVAATLAAETGGLEHAILRRALDDGSLVTAQVQEVVHENGLWRGTADGIHWFMGARTALERERPADLTTHMVPSVGFLDERSSMVLLVGRENDGLVGAIGLQIEAEPYATRAADQLAGALLPDGLSESLLKAVSDVSRLPVFTKSFGRHDVAIMGEGTPLPKIGTAIRVLSSGVPVELSADGAPRALMSALPRLAPALLEVGTALSRMATRTTLVGLAPAMVSGALAHLSVLSPALAAVIGLAGVMVGGARYGLRPQHHEDGPGAPISGPAPPPPEPAPRDGPIPPSRETSGRPD